MSVSRTTMLKPADAEKWLQRALKASAHGQAADGTLAVLTQEHSALTRFANNSIHQNVAEMMTQLLVRVDIGDRRGLATTNQLTDDGIRLVVQRACELARRAPADPHRPALPGQQHYHMIDRWNEPTANASPAVRGKLVADAIRQVECASFQAAGYLTTSATAMAVATSNGLMAYYPSTFSEYAVTVMGQGSSGWAKAKAPALGELEITRLTEQAIRTAEQGRNPNELPPGQYTVILAPAATADLVSFLAEDFSGQAVLEQHSCLTGKLGRRLFGENVTLIDDVAHPLQMGYPFDGEGVARQPVTLIENGVVRSFVYSLSSAKKSGVSPTGHGSATEPDDYPANLVLAGGPPEAETPIEQMIATMDRGLLITRCWYIREVDPTQKIVTGMTRDGTFWIEEGKIRHAVKNLRFNQGLIAMLNEVDAMSPSVRAAGEEHESCIVVPALKVRNFRFTGSTPD